MSKSRKPRLLNLGEPVPEGYVAITSIGTRSPDYNYVRTLAVSGGIDCVQYDIPGDRPGPLFVNADQVRQVLAERASDKVPGGSKPAPEPVPDPVLGQLIVAFHDLTKVVQFLNDSVSGLKASVDDLRSAVELSLEARQRAFESNGYSSTTV